VGKFTFLLNCSPQGPIEGGYDKGGDRGKPVGDRSEGPLGCPPGDGDIENIKILNERQKSEGLENN
jgi:hypothetical protein